MNSGQVALSSTDWFRLVATHWQTVSVHKLDINYLQSLPNLFESESVWVGPWLFGDRLPPTRWCMQSPCDHKWPLRCSKTQRLALSPESMQMHEKHKLYAIQWLAVFIFHRQWYLLQECWNLFYLFFLPLLIKRLVNVKVMYSYTRTVEIQCTAKGWVDTFKEVCKKQAYKTACHCTHTCTLSFQVGLNPQQETGGGL